MISCIRDLYISFNWMSLDVSLFQAIGWLNVMAGSGLQGWFLHLLVRQATPSRLEIRFCDLAAPFIYKCCVLTANLNSEKQSVFCALYRSPSSCRDSLLNLLEPLKDGLTQSKNDFIVCGDFNVDTLKEDRARSHDQEKLMFY